MFQTKLVRVWCIWMQFDYSEGQNTAVSSQKLSFFEAKWSVNCGLIALIDGRHRFSRPFQFSIMFSRSSRSRFWARNEDIQYVVLFTLFNSNINLNFTISCLNLFSRCYIQYAINYLAIIVRMK